jgi:hypothetical protein
MMFWRPKNTSTKKHHSILSRLFIHRERGLSTVFYSPQSGERINFPLLMGKYLNLGIGHKAEVIDED